MSTKIEKFKKLLSQHGIRITHQRVVILKFLSEKRLHPTVEQIYEAIKDDVTTISKTTVYNTLHTFIENGLVKDLLITANEVHYDLDGYPHHHFLCTECGKIYDLPVECCHHSTGIVQGHKISEMHGYFKGICKQCLNKMGEDEDES